MKPLLLIAFFLLPALATAQCYNGHRNKGRELLAEKKYAEAIVRFQAAKKCRLDKPVGGDKEMDELITEAKKLKSSAAAETLVQYPEMVFVQGGTFIMGNRDIVRDGERYEDELPPHEVTVKDFYIGKYEVTQSEWRGVMGSNPSYNSNCDQCPVEIVSWDAVQVFIRKLNAQTGKIFRLPTEAEWEYAARGGNKTNGYLYSGSHDVADVAWYDINANGRSIHGTQKTTCQVGLHEANELGLHDMSGNVWEWVEDDWHDSFAGAPANGGAWVNSPRSSYRVYRGGSHYSTARFCRSACRNYTSPANQGNSIGFRLALQL